MNKMKKLLSSLLALSMVLSYVPMYALAAEGDPCTVTEGCQGTYNAEGLCTVCNLAQLVVTEGTEECQHSGGTATCTALANCDECGEPYGELAAHTGGEATCRAQAVCTVCTAAYGELAAHSYENGVCVGCGDICAHAEYLDGKCKVCDMDEPVQEPVVLTITAWNWVDDYEIIDTDYMDAVIPGVGAENPIDWETLVELLPAYITAQVNGGEVEIPVTWECETFPETATGGQYTVKASLPEGYALGEEVTSLELKVDLGTVEQLDDPMVDDTWYKSDDTSFTLTTAAQLAGLAALVNKGTNFSGKTVMLGNNIDLGSYTNWTPIGKNSSYIFMGTFDGNGKTISNLKIDSDQRYVGLFGYVYNGTIKNVILETPTVSTSYSSAKASVGALVGYHTGTGNIEYCAVRNGSVSAPNSACSNNNSGLGGLVGCHNTTGKVIGCYNYMTSVSTQNNTMTRCGGVAGSVSNMAESCCTYNTNQKGTLVAGGKASGSGTTAKYSAYLKADGTASSAISTSSNSVALSAEEFANGTAAYYLRTGGYSNINNHWGQDVEGDTKQTFPVWNGTPVYPIKWVQNVDGTAKVITKYVNELETEEINGKTYRVIYDAYDWVMFANKVNDSSRDYIDWNAIVKPAGATIDFSVLGTLAYSIGYWQNVVMIGASNNSNSYYSGTFDGNGCTVTGLNFSSSGNYALFGYIEASANVSNITVKNATISGKNVATFALDNRGSLENCRAVNVAISASSTGAGLVYQNYGNIQNSSFSGSVSSVYSAGGISSQTSDNTTISGCWNEGSITATSGDAGGITATAGSGTQLTRCWNTGTISGTRSSSYFSGGILGKEASNVIIDNCYNTGDITGGYVGGIVGSCYSNYTTTVKNCHSYGATLTGTKSYPVANESMTNCYYLADSETDSVSGTTYKTAAEFKDGTVLDLLNSGNSETVWYQYIDYPILEYKEIPHQHVWNYTLNDGHNTITAVCSNNDGKTCVYASQPLSMVISASGGAYTPNGYAAMLTGDLATVLGLTSGKIQYAYKANENGTYETVTDAVNAGHYKASITVGEGDSAKTAYVEFTISKVTITEDMVSLSSESFVYDGNEKSVMVAVQIDGTALTAGRDYTVSGTTSTAALSTGEGYAVTVTGTGNFTGEIIKYWKITKATPTITIDENSAITITYGQTLKDAVIAGYTSSVEGTFVFKNPTTAPTVTDSNSTEYTLVFTPTDAVNYDSVETKVKVTVNSKEIGITWGTAEFTYDGEEKLPTASVAEGSAINGDQLGLTVALEETTEGAGTNAGTYTAKVTSITGDKAANYKLPENVTTSFEIKNASQTKPENLTGKKETIRNKADGTIAGLTTAMEISKEENGTYTPFTDGNMTFAAGTYYVRYAAKANYDASPATAITIDAGDPLRITVPGEQTAYSLTADKTDAAWHEDVTITFTLKDGYSVGADFAVKVNGQKIELDQDGKYTIQDMEAAVVVTVEGVADTTAPTVTVSLEDNWNSLWNGITFGKFFKETKTFTISAEDKETGLKTVSYYLASEELEDVTTAAVTWTAYDLTGSGVSVDPDKVFVIYAKAEDNAGNITYVNSNGIVLDKTDPVITGVTNGAVYYTTQKITANDTYLDTKKLNGTEFDGTIPGDPAQETKHTIVATDKAGNNTTFEITMKPISPLAADLPTEETVKLVDKGAIEAIKQNVSNVSTTHATDAEKAKLKDIIDRCDLLLNRIERAENVIALINAMPDVSKVEPDDKTAIDAYDAAAAAYNDANLPASSKRMVGEENKAKLDAMLKALTAYDVIKGHKSSYTRGSGKTFSLTANGYFGKFTGLKIDGRILDSKYYTAKSGSTIVTLKNSYLDSLSDGKHTVEFLYTDGSTGGDHYFRISTNNGSPFTGDNNHIMMFSGIMMTSLLCMAMMIMFVPRKKGKYQR